MEDKTELYISFIKITLYKNRKVINADLIKIYQEDCLQSDPLIKAINTTETSVYLRYYTALHPIVYAVTDFYL
jgi:hypothetical protein